MLYSRAGVVAVLLAAEVFIGGAILWALTAGHAAWPARAAGFRVLSEQGKTYPSIAAGDSPHVVVDDADSRVVISASTDGRVHVTDDSGTFGWVWGGTHSAPLQVDRTNDGVSISRAGGGRALTIVGLDYQHTAITVPSGSFVDVRHCGGADLAGLTGQVQVNCDDGRIRGSDLHVAGGSLHTEDGSVYLALLNPALAIRAHTDDGTIRINGRRLDREDDSDSADYQTGTSGGGSLKVSTSDGNIHISTNGAL